MRKRKEHIIKGLLWLSLSISFSPVFGQVLTPHLPENKWLFTAEDQHQQQHYKASAAAAKNYLEQQKSRAAQNSDAAEKARYDLVIAKLYLKEQGCDVSAIDLIARTANPAYKQRASYALAQYYFRQNSFNNAIAYYELAGIANLTNDEIAYQKFELAYCYFNTKQFDKAEPLLASIKELQGKYYAAGNYYYGLLAYSQNNYTEALTSFQRVASEKDYKDVVPYYIGELYYFTGDKEKALEQATGLVKAGTSYYDNEAHLLAAQVLFEKQQYAAALPYFEHYYQHTDKIRKEDLYEMGFAYYNTKQWQNAIDKFKPLSNTQDSLGQSAMYMLGDCYLKTEDRKSARNAFSLCADMPYNKQQQETSLLFAAKLSYEMGYNDEAINRLNELLGNFPSSTYRDDAKTILSDLLIKTSNYALAFRQLQDVTTRNEHFRGIYQKVTYGYALQQIQNGDLVYANTLLDLSLEQQESTDYEAVAAFWKAEVSYKLQHYNDALVYDKRFLSNGTDQREIQKISAAATAENAHLTMGYAAMQLNDFAAAQQYFNKSRQSQGTGSALAVNATLREADAAFMQKNYAEAIGLYNNVMEGNGTEADYARFQKAIILGLQAKNNEKANLLQSLISKTPASVYANDARYELALVHIESDKYQAAINTLQPVISSGDGRMASKALMKTAFAYQQLKHDDEAIKAYRLVVTNYPASEERPAAIDALKSLYLEHNQPGAYATFLKENNIGSASDNSLDSAYYTAAENQFSSGNFEKAKLAMQEYLKQYPNGIFVTKANFYKAESHYQLKEYNDALASYDAVLARGWSDFAENSAKHAAALAYQNKDYAAAVKYYTSLRSNALNANNLQLAYSGLMQSNYALNKYDEAAAYADTLSALPGIDENTKSDILLLKGRSLQRNNKTGEALSVYQQLEAVKKSAVAAEARYHIAELYLQQGKLKEAETAANNTIQKSAGNDYWIVKSYILIADILTEQKDYFNAKATLQSIAKNTKVAELKQEAAMKLEQVKALEKKQSKLKEE